MTMRRNQPLGGNILINSNGASIIDQRSKLNVGITAAGYGVDCWKVIPTSGDTITVTQGAGKTKVQVDGANGDGGIRQYVEDWEQYKGKTITVSARGIYSGGASGIGYVAISDGATWSSAPTFISAMSERSLTVTVPTSATELAVSFWTSGTHTTGEYIEFEWVKLEEGSVATKYEIPEKNQELAKCLPYSDQGVGINHGDDANRVMTNASVVNQNLFINSNGRDPVNQDNISDGDIMNGGYCTIDQWTTWIYDCTAKYSTSHGGQGFVLSDIGTDTPYVRYWEQIDSSKLISTTLTLSVGVISNNSNVKALITDGTADYYSNYHTGDGTVQVLTVTRDIVANPSSLHTGVEINAGITDGTYVEIVWAKLEYGTVATKYCPPLKSQALLDCQYYYQVIRQQGGYGIIGSGFGASSSDAYIQYKLNVPMRIIPILSASSPTHFKIIGNADNIELTSIGLKSDAHLVNSNGECISVGIQATVGSGVDIVYTYCMRFKGDTTAWLKLDSRL